MHQDPARPCQHPGCQTEVVWRGSGRKPRYCHEHQNGKYAKARQRTRDSQPQDQGPPCCEAAGRRAGRISCPQHKPNQNLDYWDVGQGSPDEDYAGALPVATHTASEDAQKVGDIKHELHGVRVGMPDDTRILTGSREGWWQAMTECYSYGPLAGARIKVIGQPDLTADWQPSRHPDARALSGLIRRGPDWPWAEVAEAPRVAA